ncbi:hypothetical protein HOD08_02295 [bacterium]|nr:hypothetical protein [bacterium]
MRKIFFISVALFSSLGINSKDFDDINGMIVQISDECLDVSPLVGATIVETPSVQRMLELGEQNSPRSDLIKQFFFIPADGELKVADETHFTSLLSQKGLGVLTGILRNYEHNKDNEKNVGALKKEITETFNKDATNLFTKTHDGAALRKFNGALSQALEKDEGYIKLAKKLVLARSWKTYNKLKDSDDFISGLEEKIVDSDGKPKVRIPDEKQTSQKFDYQNLRKLFLDLPGGVSSNDRLMLLLFAGRFSAATPETIPYKFKAQFRDKEVANCGETAILGLFNFIRSHRLGGADRFGGSSDTENLFEIFGISKTKFEDFLESGKINPDLTETPEEAKKYAAFRAIAFFMMHPTTDSQKSDEAHTKWLHVVSNLPNIEYRKENAEMAGGIEPGKMSSVEKVVQILTQKPIKELVETSGLSYSSNDGEKVRQFQIFSDDVTFELGIAPKHFTQTSYDNIVVDALEILNGTNKSEFLPIWLAQYSQFGLARMNQPMDEKVIKTDQLAEVVRHFQKLPKGQQDEFFRDYLLSGFTMNTNNFGRYGRLELLFQTGESNIIGGNADNLNALADSYMFMNQHHLKREYAPLTGQFSPEFAEKISHIFPNKKRMNFLVENVSDKKAANELVTKVFTEKELPDAISYGIKMAESPEDLVFFETTMRTALPKINNPKERQKIYDIVQLLISFTKSDINLNSSDEDLTDDEDSISEDDPTKAKKIEEATEGLKKKLSAYSHLQKVGLEVEEQIILEQKEVEATEKRKAEEAEEKEKLGAILSMFKKAEHEAGMDEPRHPKKTTKKQAKKRIKQQSAAPTTSPRKQYEEGLIRKAWNKFRSFVSTNTTDETTLSTSPIPSPRALRLTTPRTPRH